MLMSHDVPDIVGCICSDPKAQLPWMFRMGQWDTHKAGSLCHCQLELAGFPQTDVNWVAFSDVASESHGSFISFPGSYQGGSILRGRRETSPLYRRKV